MDATDDERLVERRDRDLAVQRVVDALADEGPHADAALVTDTLVRRLADAGVPPMPEPWVASVVADLMEGNPYVVSAFTEAQADVPAPEHPARSEIID
ncbi:MAG: hypothetical protein IE926_02490 [Micrococcales bacterium]|uniref:hypothetical protein n=1 Tax=Phycicoccus sp. TaxID=1902410 RepID=UPI0019C81582|nr:hypothetical protein [Phycicoccus sp.]MBD3781814.1 hypothetical protein [Micrococcales bacterium]HMM96630.1 hypothetical protein [Phycicoccus sp.]